MVMELSVCEPGLSCLPPSHICDLFASKSLAYPFLLFLFVCLVFGFDFSLLWEEW